MSILYLIDSPVFILACVFLLCHSKQDGDKDLQSRLAIKAAESSIKEESVHSHDPFPVVERSDGTVVNPLHNDDDSSSLPSPPTTSESSPSSTTVLMSGKESPTSSSSPSATAGTGGGMEAHSSVSLNGAPSPPESVNSSSPVMISSSGLGLSTSDLNSVSSVGSGGSSNSAQCYHHHVQQYHGSTTSINSGTISSGDSVFTDRSSPQELVSTTAATQRSKSSSPDGSCVPDSTTVNTSSPLGVQLTGNSMVRTDSADLGYKSGSSPSPSLRDRLTSGVSYGASPMTRTDSNASSIISNHPLSASSSVGSLQSHGTTGSTEFNSHSTFHQGVRYDSNNFMPAVDPTTFTPLTTQATADQYSNTQYIQQNQPVSSVAGNANTNASFPLMYQQQMGTQFVISAPFGVGQNLMTNMGNGAPRQQFVQQSSLPMNGVGVDPIKTLPDWTPAPAVSDFNAPLSSTSAFSSNAGGTGSSGVPPQQQGGINPMFNLQTTGGSGFEYISPSMPGSGLPQEIYNPPPITASGSGMYNGSNAGIY